MDEQQQQQQPLRRGRGRPRKAGPPLNTQPDLRIQLEAARTARASQGTHQGLRGVYPPPPPPPPPPPHPPHGEQVAENAAPSFHPSMPPLTNSPPRNHAAQRTHSGPYTITSGYHTSHSHHQRRELRQPPVQRVIPQQEAAVAVIGRAERSTSSRRSGSTLLGTHSEEILGMMKQQMAIIEQQGKAIAELQRQHGTPTAGQTQPYTPVNVGLTQVSPVIPLPPPNQTDHQSDDLDEGHPGHPFTSHIMDYQIPQGYLGPTNIPRYNGLTDPMEHILSYEGALNFYGGGDKMKCRAFSMTLHSSVLRWYSTLPQNSINCWKDMKEVFLNRYTASCIQPRSDHTLATVTQEPEESLRKYLSRFHNESSSVPNLESGVAVLLFTQGLAPRDFRNSLIGKPPRDMAELR